MNTGIDYALASELKAVGFPQEVPENVPVGYILPSNNPITIGTKPEWVPQDAVRLPTLSELITDCGDEFDSIYRIEDMWHARRDHDAMSSIFRGATPEEAVARLRLSLKKI